MIHPVLPFNDRYRAVIHVNGTNAKKRPLNRSLSFFFICLKRSKNDANNRILSRCFKEKRLQEMRKISVQWRTVIFLWRNPCLCFINGHIKRH